MDLMRTFNNYCERLGPEFWAEPVNALTNGAFIVAAVLAYMWASRKGLVDWPIIALMVITFMVGIGSFLFHTFATFWALLADVIPIQIFILFYFWFVMRRFAGFSAVWSSVATVLFFVGAKYGADILGALLGDSLNGSEGYIPPLAALIVVGAALVGSGRRGAGFSLVVAGLILAVSVTFRTVDAAVCADFPLGTHFLWHTLNGVLLGFLIVAMARFGVPKGRDTTPA